MPRRTSRARSDDLARAGESGWRRAPAATDPREVGLPSVTSSDQSWNTAPKGCGVRNMGLDHPRWRPAPARKMFLIIWPTSPAISIDLQARKARFPQLGNGP